MDLEHICQPPLVKLADVLSKLRGNHCLFPGAPSALGVHRVDQGVGQGAACHASHRMPPLTWMEGNTKPTMKLVSQCTAPSTMKAAGREDCRKISVLTTEGTGPQGQKAQDKWSGEGVGGPYPQPQTL